MRLPISSYLKKLSKGGLFLLLILLSGLAKAQLTITPNQNAAQLVQQLVGTGVITLNATLNCPGNANGKFVSSGTTLGLDSGIVLTSGQAATTGTTPGVNGAYSLFATTDNGAPGDPALTAISGQTTNDACILEFDFVPAGDTIKFDYIFGSEEYNGPHGNFNCSINDVFAFFISGPGITGTPNIALVPGTTNVAVGVSTINDGVSATPGGPCYTNTFGNGPYTALYVNNGATNPYLVYTGRTQTLTAMRAVIPCDTYHLKLAIADASDGVWDSGVFLKAGSLNSAAIHIQPIGGGGGLTAPVPYCVRGCLPGQFVFTRPDPRPTPLTIKYLIQGTATNGVDYTLIPDSVVIPANQTSAVRTISGIPVTPATGVETVKLMVLSPYSCGSGTPIIIDSAELAIYDSFYVRILNNDTAVCKYETVSLEAEGDNLLTYTWTPNTWLSTNTGKTTDASPEVTTTYTVSANIPGSGCPDAHDYVTITVKEEPDVDAGPDTVTCLGTPYQFNVNVLPSTQTYTYSWSPGTYLSNPTISNPTSSPTADVTYVITVNSGAAGCNGYDTVTLRVLPNDFLLGNHDTAICAGANVQINAVGDPAFTYTWTPTTDVSNPNILTPSLTPDTSRNYTVTATFPGCPNISKSLFIDVQPNPIVNAGADREMCQFDTVQLHGTTLPTWYPNYAYSWSPGADLNDPTQDDVAFSGLSTTTLTLTVTTPAGCSGTDDVTVTVKPGNFGSIIPTGDTAICPNETVQFVAGGGVSYQWTPGYTLTDSMIADPIGSPTATTDYQVIIGSADGCTDTFITRVTVNPAALIDLGEDQTIYPGESYPMNPQGNCMYFAWQPPTGLSATNISNPDAQPMVNTRYYAIGQTEHGCTAIDSIDIFVSNTVLDMPNAFTPGSGANNQIKIIKRGIATLKYLRIFNRWGAVVFETTNIDEGWDGRLNGAIQPMGVYVYTIEAVTQDGRPFVKQGNITLIR